MKLALLTLTCCAFYSTRGAFLGRSSDSALRGTSSASQDMGPSRLYRNPSQNCKNPRWTRGLGPPGGPTINDFRFRKFEKTSKKFRTFLFGENWALRKSCKNHFPMVRVNNLRSLTRFFLRFGPSGNHAKMIFRWSGQQTNLRSFSSFLFLKHTPLENHEKTTFRAFLETKGPRDPPWVQERRILFRIALQSIF